MPYTSIIEEYLAGGERLRAAVAGLSREQLNAFPVPGTWSIQQICVHLLHAEIFAVGRMCQIIAEDVPLLMNWDENTFVARLRYESMAIDDVVNCLACMRRTMGTTLSQLKPDDFQRHGIHSKAGKVTLDGELRKYVSHLAHHLHFIEQKRSLLLREP